MSWWLCVFVIVYVYQGYVYLCKCDLYMCIKVCVSMNDMRMCIKVCESICQRVCARVC